MVGAPMLNAVVVYQPPAVPAVRAGSTAVTIYRPRESARAPPAVDTQFASASDARGDSSPASLVMAQQLGSLGPAMALFAIAGSAYAATATRADTAQRRRGQVLDTQV